jgi:hypothetical protein
VKKKTRKQKKVRKPKDLKFSPSVYQDNELVTSFDPYSSWIGIYSTQDRPILGLHFDSKQMRMVGERFIKAADWMDSAALKKVKKGRRVAVLKTK